MIKVSDYIAQLIKSKSVKHVFCVAGGASLHLIHSLAKYHIEYICNQHEQAAAMCADAYSRITGFGVAIATSGPGGTNLITGIAGAYYDSIPCLFITGQVSTFRRRKNTRQLGFQETDIVDICKPITKYAYEIKSAKEIVYQLDKAIHIAQSDRQGPVLIDIPDNIQRETINLDDADYVLYSQIHKTTPKSVPNQYIRQLLNAKKPLIIIGAGIKRARAEKELYKFIYKTGYPVVATWGAADILNYYPPQYINTFGTHAYKCNNCIINEADVILSLGARLDTKAIGSKPEEFAPLATKIVVDIDDVELQKFPFKISAIHADVKDVLNIINGEYEKTENDLLLKVWHQNSKKNWYKLIHTISENYLKHLTTPPDEYRNGSIEKFIIDLSELCYSDSNIVLDTGCTLPWVMQHFNFRTTQTLLHDWNNTAMGWALPASIAAYLANHKPTLCIMGDGSFQMNVQELALVHKHLLPIKIIVLNNSGYAMIRQTQDEWLNSHYIASSEMYGLPSISCGAIAKAYNINSIKLDLLNIKTSTVQAFLDSNRAELLEIIIPTHACNKHQVKFGESLC